MPPKETTAQIYTVSSLTLLLKRELENRFGEIWVEGEISNLKIPSSGHLYMTLKDGQAQLRCVLFRSSGRQLKFVPRDGQQVLCRGRITVYEPRGDYQLVLDYLEPRGVGALQLAFEQLKERLQREGLFDPARKKPLPALPRRIAIVTSPTGAAIRDILKVLHRRFVNLQVLILPVPVQGESAAPAIAAAVDEANALGGFDALILARGGGSIEDLWAFNEEAVARAIVRSGIPVISAVGHEVDYTISDFVADLRAPTPSAAAEMVVLTKQELLERIEAARHRLARILQHGLALARNRVEAHRRVLRDPRRAIEAHLLRLDELEGRLKSGVVTALRHASLRLRHASDGLRHRRPVERLHRLAMQFHEAVKRLELNAGHFLRQKRNRWEALSAAMNNLSPLAILSRGYSITRRLPEMSLLKSSRAVEPGARIHVLLKEGSLICHVEKTTG